MAYVRTLLGDLNPATLGACNAHEHLVIAGDFIAQRFPDYLLDDADAAGVDLAEFKAAGGGWVIDTMPTGPGRDAARLAELSRRSGLAIVCPTGLHLPLYYPEDHPLLTLDAAALTQRFIREIQEGLDDGNGPLPHRAGVIKVAGGRDRLSDHQREAFAAAAAAHRATGCPIITHTEQGTAGLEQAELFRDAGVDLGHVVLSHCDRQPDPAYHRDLLQTGVCLEYDDHFRSLARDGTCPSARLLAELAPQFPDQILVGMDLARRSYWRGHGGSPGLAWLLTALPRKLADAGLDAPLIHRIYHENPARAFAFSAAASTV